MYIPKKWAREDSNLQPDRYERPDKDRSADFPDGSTRSIVFVASYCDRLWCETRAVIAACRIEDS